MLTNEELLRGFGLLCALARGNILYGRDKYGDMMINEIRALIENRPMVEWGNVPVYNEEGHSNEDVDTPHIRNVHVYNSEVVNPDKKMTTDNIEKARDILEIGMAEFNVDKMKWAKGIASNNSFKGNVEYLMALLETVMQLLSSGEGEARE